MDSRQCRMKGPEVASVIDKKAALLRPDEKAPRGDGENGSTGARLAQFGQKLAERAPIEGQNPGVGGCDDQFGLAGIREGGAGDFEKFGRGQLSPYAKLAQGPAALVELRQAGRTCDK